MMYRACPEYGVDGCTMALQYQGFCPCSSLINVAHVCVCVCVCGCMQVIVAEAVPVSLLVAQKRNNIQSYYECHQRVLAEIRQVPSEA